MLCAAVSGLALPLALMLVLALVLALVLELVFFLLMVARILRTSTLVFYLGLVLVSASVLALIHVGSGTRCFCN